MDSIFWWQMFLLWVRFLTARSKNLGQFSAIVLTNFCSRIQNTFHFSHFILSLPNLLLHTWFCQNPQNLFQLANKLHLTILFTLFLFFVLNLDILNTFQTCFHETSFRDRDSFDLIQSKFLLYQYSLYTTLSFVKIHKICLIIMFFRCFVSERLINYLIIINLVNFTYQYCLCPIQLLHTWFCQNPRNLFQLANKSRWCEHPIQSHFPNGLWQNRSTHFLHWKQGAL